MKIEAGRYYRTSHGQKVGPLIDRNPGPHERTKWKDPFGRCWYADGTGFLESNGNLIAEWTDTPDLTALTTPFGLLDRDTQEALKAHGGPYEHFFERAWRPTIADPDIWADYLAFRVKPAPPKPREWWISPDSLFAAKAPPGSEPPPPPFVLVREVLPE